MEPPADAQAVLDAWFGPGILAGRDGPRPEWFRKDPAFDDALRTRFGTLVARAQAGELADWTASAEGTLALIVVLDQFSRNIHRGSPSSFAGDARALALARVMIDTGLDRGLPPVARMFVYLPFEHSEVPADQDVAVARMTALGVEDARLADLGEWAEKHRVVIRRFGRFPHRNAVLGRASTPEEEAFLREPGSSF